VTRGSKDWEGGSIIKPGEREAVVQPTQVDNPGVLVWPPLLFASTLLIGGLLHCIFPVRLLAPLPARITGAFITLAAGFFALWAERVMKAAGTNVRPDKPALTIVTTGPFRFTRNPMYLSLCGLQVGIALLINGVMPLLFVLPLILVLHFGVIRREERYLAAKFGDAYLSFKARTRRWI
jgi:protein-S-isoprenylcysteine O-methyltransferase Ste14